MKSISDLAQLLSVKHGHGHMTKMAVMPIKGVYW